MRLHLTEALLTVSSLNALMQVVSRGSIGGLRHCHASFKTSLIGAGPSVPYSMTCAAKCDNSLVSQQCWSVETTNALRP